jgi:hypothetical protein
MSYTKCDLCGVDDAIENGLLCPSCWEAIARLLAIGKGEQFLHYETFSEAIDMIDHPERKRSTGRAGS